MAISETLKLIIAVLIGCALLFGAQTIMEWKQGAEDAKQLARQAKATTGITADAEKTTEQRLVIDVGLLESRAEFIRQQEEEKHRDPEIAERAERAVPASRLRAFRERRLARERLGCVGEQCKRRPAPAPASER